MINKRVIVGLVVASFIAVATVAHAGWELISTCENSQGQIIKLKWSSTTTFKDIRWGIRIGTAGNMTWYKKDLDQAIAENIYNELCAM